MPAITIQNDDFFPNLVDARLSSGSISFLDMPLVPDFPRWLKPGELVKIEMGNYNELVFRRTMNSRGHPVDNKRLSDLYRIAVTIGKGDLHYSLRSI